MADADLHQMAPEKPVAPQTTPEKDKRFKVLTA